MGVGVSSSHFVSTAPSSSHSSPAPVWSPFHRRQFSMNCSNVSPSQGLQFLTNCPRVGPFHGVQSFKNRLLQCVSPTGSQVLSASLLQRGLLSPWVHRSCQEPAPERALQGVTDSFGLPPASVWGPPWVAGRYLLHCGPPWAAEGQPALPWSSPQAAGEALLRPLEHLLPLLLSVTLISAEFFLAHILAPLSPLFFFPHLLNTLCQRLYHHH